MFKSICGLAETTSQPNHWAPWNSYPLRDSHVSCITLVCPTCNQAGRCQVLPEWLGRALYGARVEPFLVSWGIRY